MASPQSASLLLPTPFVGRQKELLALRDCIAASPLTLLHGASGIGKSSLLAAMLRASPIAHVVCAVAPGQSADAVLSRVCRHIGTGRYGLSAKMQSEELLIVIEAAHRLPAGALEAIIEQLAPDPTWMGRVVIAARDASPRADMPRYVASMQLGAMPREEAQAAWQAWLERHKTAAAPTIREAFATAYAAALGMPERLRLALGELLCDKPRHQLHALTGPERTVLAALATWREPMTMATLGALVAPLGAFDVLCALDRYQWIDIDERGSVAIPDRFGEMLLADLPADLLDATSARVVAQLAAEDTADMCAPFDAVERLRERTVLRLRQGEIDQAIADVTHHAGAILTLGASVELDEIISAIGQATAPVLRATKLDIAVREGRIGEAGAMLELLGDASQISLPLRASVEIARGNLAAAYALIAAAWHDESWRNSPQGARSWRLLRRLSRLGSPVALPAPTSQAPLVAALLETTNAEDAMALGDFSAARHHVTRARGALAIMQGPGEDGGALGFELDCLYARCLLGEGLLLEAAEETARIDGDQRLLHYADARLTVLTLRAVLARGRGDTDAAVGLLREVSRARRRHGDELGAMLSDGELADTYLLRGELTQAVELGRSLGMRQLGDLGQVCQTMAHAIIGRVLRLEWRLAEAQIRLQAAVATRLLPFGMRRRAERWLADTNARLAGTPTSASPADDISDWIARADHLMTLGNNTEAFALATRAATESERRGAKALCAKSFAVLARILFLRADTVQAEAAASRAVRDAAATGVVQARCHGLFVLASTRRDAGDTKTAMTYARDAFELAGSVGLVVERLVGHAAYESLAGSPIALSPETTFAITMSTEALSAARSFAAQLGLGRQNAVEVINARGERTHLAAAGPDMLRYRERALVVDGTRDEVWIGGELIADLRRRSLLKKLLFLFCDRPGTPISKEEIVRFVWEVDYHPLRHDAAIFTNIMRLRKLLGETGPKWLRGDETGYTFTPPDDYLFVSRG
ncbi:MAG: winged helix-turn-helix domain-containing protein [Myxococcales bacterium]|nr:winged helix-turn-helix domain-containing protein [Myxococcales bacterium]